MVITQLEQIIIYLQWIHRLFEENFIIYLKRCSSDIQKIFIAFLRKSSSIFFCIFENCSSCILKYSMFFIAIKNVHQAPKKRFNMYQKNTFSKNV